jgi:uncharacterized protein
MLSVTLPTDRLEPPLLEPFVLPAARGTATPRRLFVSGLASFAAGLSPAWSETTPSGSLLVTVYGDSQAEGLAVALLAATRGSHFHVANRTKAGTALGQPAAYDWVAAVHKSVTVDHPAIAVLMFGGNDRVPTHLPDGHTLAFRGDPWLAYYRDRVQKLIAALTVEGTMIVWCGEPNTEEERYANDMAYLNEIYREALHPTDATFVDIWDVATSPAGTYVSHGPGTDGVVQRLRTDDGIHFTAAGYGLVAQRVLRAIEQIAARKLSPAVAQPASEIHATATDAEHGEF